MSVSFSPSSVTWASMSLRPSTSERRRHVVERVMDAHVELLDALAERLHGGLRAQIRKTARQMLRDIDEARLQPGFAAVAVAARVSVGRRCQSDPCP